MARYNFEGDFDNISERQLEFINEVIQKQDLKVNKVVFYPVGQAGDNFVASVKRINVEGENGSLKMIAKIASGLEMVRNSSNTKYMFKNEHVMYTEVLPKLVQLQKDSGVPKEEQLRYAKCYGSLDEEPNEVVLLEDLNELNFVMLNKFESLSNECVKSVLKNFAVLHSLSHVLKRKEPHTYGLFRSKLSNIWAIMAENKLFSSQMQIVETDLASKFDEAHKSIIKNKLTGVFKLALEYERNGDDANSVILQGDAWTNNIMFKFLDDDSVQSIMIDYQVSKSFNPVVDILYMIFNCTDHETRSKNYYNWLDHYYSELDHSLSNFDLKADFVYPRSQLDADIKKYSNLIFGISLALANLLMRDTSEAKQLLDIRMKTSDISEVYDAMSKTELHDDTLARFKNRVIGIINSFKEFGLF